MNAQPPEICHDRAPARPKNVRALPWVLLACLSTIYWCAMFAHGQQQPMHTLAADQDELILHDALVIGRTGRSGRAALHTDAVEAMIVGDRWHAPTAGGEVTLPDGTVRLWQPAAAAESGWLNHQSLRGGYAFFTVRSDADRVMILHAQGHSRVYVNGELRAGDPYRTGFVQLPVKLHRGLNEFLFHVSRGGVWARLDRPAGPVTIAPGDRTLPDLIQGESAPVVGAIVISNNSEEPLIGLILVASGGGGLPTRETSVPAIGPMTIRKVPFWTGDGPPPQVDRYAISLRLIRRDATGRETTLDETTVDLAVRSASARHKRTFISGIDGSVQYYALTPSVPAARFDDLTRPGLVLTLHGAGVEATGQAAAYQPKAWVDIVAPTNRRPYGFDWEDWGRLDFLEVFALAVDRLRPDSRRIYLSGHSMGGHGVWHIGATYPDLFAAIAPSAGWVSFTSYTGAAQYAAEKPIPAMLKRAVAGSDTVALSRNYIQHGVYILHGEKDDNVPVQQARSMNELLSEFHPDYTYHEQPGAGHWWGNQCVDWDPLFDFLSARTRPVQSEVRHIEFWTASPGISATSQWVGIEAQHHALVPSSVVIDFDPETRRYRGTTTNVARLAIKVLPSAPDDPPISIELDGQEIQVGPLSGEGAMTFWLARDRPDGQWIASTKAPSPSLKGPHRYGPFKNAFRNNMIFVYGTQGTPEENRWAYVKARYDAETFWYRGNGSVDLVRDVQFDPNRDRDRNVILYGHSEMNAAFAPLLQGSPVSVLPNMVVLDDIALPGDLACLFVRPRPGSPTALVGVVAGNSLAGLRLTDRLPYFVSGVGYPDCIVIETDSLRTGDAGIRVAGFFGNDWSITNGDFAWRED